MKASDITDEQIYQAVDEICAGQSFVYPVASRWEIHKKLPQYPEKVLMAKLRRMVKRKRLAGCACGCRGDFHRIGKGIEDGTRD